MKKQIDYLIIEERTLPWLKREVKERLKEGYFCVGGCTQIVEYDDRYFIQAMVKYED